MKHFRKLTLLAALALAVAGTATANAQPAPGFYPPPPGYGGPPPGGPGWHHWHRGDRYWGRAHYVDWRRYQLPPPPYGYRWLKEGPQFVLIGGNGYVAQVLVR